MFFLTTWIIDWYVKWGDIKIFCFFFWALSILIVGYSWRIIVKTLDLFKKYKLIKGNTSKIVATTCVFLFIYGQSNKLYSKTLIMILNVFKSYHCGNAMKILTMLSDIFTRLSNILIVNIMHFVIVWQLASIRENFD